MSTNAEIKNKLKGMRLFAEFNDEELANFADLVEPASFKTGETIVRQDDAGDCMFLVVAGRVDVIHRRNQKRFKLATLGAGDFFGEISLVDKGPRSADVEAAEDCTLLRVPQSVINALAGVYPAAAFKLLVAIGRVLVSRMRGANQKYIDSLMVMAEK
jgi:CRP/FNR family transcriptional regulator, cyclic AMP receptor protein